MPRFSDQQLRDKALQALEEAYALAEKGLLPPSKSLRFLLAYLSNDVDRQAVDAFWCAATSGITESSQAEGFGRLQSLRNAYRYLHRQLGVEPPQV